MITYAESLSAGNAVKLVTPPAAGATYMRILCKSSDTFTGPADPNALTIVDNWPAPFFVDARDSLVNGVPVVYRCYDNVGGVWVDQGVSFPVTPATTFGQDGLDPQEFVRDRVQLGLNAAITAGWLLPNSGAIQVTTAPFSLAENTTFPTVSVHHESTAPEVRAIGDQIGDFQDPESLLWDAEPGWLARVALNVVGVSQNADERIQLRKVLRQIVQANFPVWAGTGMALVEFHQTDSEQFTQDNVPLYFTNGAFSCVAPAFIDVSAGDIAAITLDPAAVFPGGQPDYYGVASI